MKLTFLYENYAGFGFHFKHNILQHQQRINSLKENKKAS